MNKMKYLALLLMIIPVWVACDDDLKFNVTEVDAPVLVSSNPADNATQVSVNIDTLTLTFDKNIYFATANASQITLNGESVDKAIVYGASNTLSIYADLLIGTTYTLSVPAGLITGPNNMDAGAISITFTTESQNIDTNPCNAYVDEVAAELYASMVSNYGSKIYSATMADVNWNYDNATKVYEWTGKYPAINCFDYLHLPYSPSSWIDYSDITPVREWAEAGGIVAAMWHWNVPVSEGADTYSFSSDGTEFSVSNALTTGTWENEVLNEDLASIAAHLKLLQEEGIPVLWRPLHEASGGWFWWGAEEADSFVALWQTMFIYFQEQGINNLVWVWTSEGGDDVDWYPGDEYVDIIGIDIYNEMDASTIQNLYTNLTNRYPHKMITMSECGSVATISSQWSAASYWSWFMPWYDSTGEDGNAITYSDQEWWQDAMNQSYVIVRGE